MSRYQYSPRDLTAIALGGVAGSSLRWTISQLWPDARGDGGWFAYSPNTSVTVGTNIAGFEPVGSSQTIATATAIPLDTLLVNLCGCMLLGILTVLLSRSGSRSRRLLLGAATGFCGSLTTFSTFAVEVAALLRAAPILPPELVGLNARFDRDESSIVLYLLLSIVGGALAFWLGRRAAQRIVSSPGELTIGGSS